jgi:hypothetical protein
MNPETGKLEKLKFDMNAEEQLTTKLAQLQGKLLRPDGTPVPKHWAVFKVGELVTLKDNTFKVAYMNEGTMVLEPVLVEQAMLPQEKK